MILSTVSVHRATKKTESETYLALILCRVVVAAVVC